MKRPKGPQLKMPDLKGVRAPAFLADVYYDLRDRRLLPLVALVAVAIAAVPFLLGDKPEDLPEPPAESPLATELESPAERSAGLTVVEANPGLRDYRKRLRRRSPTDPFKQRYTKSNLEGAKLNPQTETASTSETTTATSTSPTVGGGSGGGSEPSGGVPKPPSTDPSPETSPPSGGGGGKPDVTLYAFAIKVRIAKSGGEAGKKQEPVVRERVLPLTPLPGKKAPVVTYMGASEKGKALLLVSDKVESVFGETKCVSGSEDVCQLIAVEPGFPVTFVYGGNEVRYTINVVKIEPVVVGRR